MKMVHDTFYGKMIVSWLIFLCCFSSGAFSQLTADFSINNAQGCAPLTVSFSNQSSGTTTATIYAWDFGNGNTSAAANAGAVFLTTGTYNITLSLKEGNTVSIKTKQVIVLDKPLVDFSASVIKGCLPLQVDFTATATSANSSISNYTWDFGDGNTVQNGSAVQGHSFSIPQFASVSLTVSNASGCSNTIQKDSLVQILPALQAAFSANQTILCRINDPVQFINTSSGPGTLSYAWDFGDATTSALTAPSHVFNVRGIYNVTLTTTSSVGCTSTVTQPGFINVASFTSNFTTPVLVCKNDYLNFNNSSTPNPTGADWFIDGQLYSTNLNAISYSAAATGNHIIKLKNQFGSCVDSISKTIVVNDIPNLQGFLATPLTNCGAPVTYQFRDTTATAVKWGWNMDKYWLAPGL